jgi:hypothetical protein
MLLKSAVFPRGWHGTDPEPIGDGEWGADAAQRDLYGNVVAADDEQHAQGGVVAGLVAQVVIDE